MTNLLILAPLNIHACKLIIKILNRKRIVDGISINARTRQKPLKVVSKIEEICSMSQDHNVHALFPPIPIPSLVIG